MTVIIQLQDPDSGAVHRWESGDGTFIGGQVSLGQGDEASSLRFEIADPRLALSNALPLPTKSARVPVECWFGPGPAPPKVFAGYVSSYTPTIAPDRLDILVTDKAKGARRVKKSRNLTVSDAAGLVRFVADENDLAVDISQADLAQVQFGTVLQHGETDLQVLGRMMSATGHSVYVRGETLFVRKNDSVRDGNRTARLQYGVNVGVGLRFEIDEFTQRTTPNVFDFEGDAANASDVEAVDRPVQLGRTGLAIQQNLEPSFTSQQVEKAMKAQGRAKEVFKAIIPATEAFPEIDVDDFALLEGFGPRLSGVWNIKSLTHDLKLNTTSFELYNGGAP